MVERHLREALVDSSDTLRVEFAVAQVVEFEFLVVLKQAPEHRRRQPAIRFLIGFGSNIFAFEDRFANLR